MKPENVTRPLFLTAVFLITGLCIAQEPQAEDYHLSMSGALINDWCSRQWQEQGYITQHACNYALSQRYDLEISSTHFSGCAVANGGDIIKIADCMLQRFNNWVAHSEADPNK